MIEINTNPSQRELNWFGVLFALAFALTPTVSTFADDDARMGKSAKRPSAKAAIAWFGTWKQGVAEAKRTNRPILLISAAPQCHGVSGIW